MNKSLMALLVCALFYAPLAFSQTPVCGFDLLNSQLRKDPAYVSEREALETKIRERVQAMEQQQLMFQNMNVLPGPVYEIPVVVHILNPGPSVTGWTEPTDAEVQEAINRLNANFAAMGTRNSGPDIPIRFALARRTSSCTPTNGINRINASAVANYNANGVLFPGTTGVTAADESELMALSKWSNKSYYNIWVVWKIASSAAPGTFTAGYAYLPPTSGGNFAIVRDDVKDGMMIMGSQLTSATSTTLTHEMGHAFGLYHTFEGGSASACPSNTGNCNAIGDRVCDTDPVKNLLQANACSISDAAPNECNANAPFNGAQRNIMGYGGCLNLLTLGQSTRMLAALEESRRGLKSSVGSTPPPVTAIKPNTTQVPQNIQNVGNSFGIGPRNVTLENLVYQSGGYSFDGNQYYIDNSCNFGTRLSAGGNNTIYVTTDANPQVCKVWIDFDNNGSFDPVGELVMNSIGGSGSYTHTATLSSSKLAGAAKAVPLRMRVMSDFVTNTGFGPASQLEDGQTEDFWVIMDGSLPVVFGALTAKQTTHNLIVGWQTEGETSSDHFFVEASVDGENFTRIASLKSKAADGNSALPLNYQITIDKNGGVVAMGIVLATLFSAFSFKRSRRLMLAVIITGTCIFVACQKADLANLNNNGSNIKYIRIAQVDKDGTTHYSRAVSVVSE